MIPRDDIKFPKEFLLNKVSNKMGRIYLVYRLLLRE